jgi:hypothetical protein
LTAKWPVQRSGQMATSPRSWKSTTYDPALGYPITNDDRDTRLDSGSMFDNVTNPLGNDSYDDVHGDEDGTLGSLGGGGEYSTGEIVL